MSEATFNYVQPNSADNNIDVTCHNGTVNVAIENPWAGSTETGFGYTCYVSMPVEKAHDLGRFLLNLK